MANLIPPTDLQARRREITGRAVLVGSIASIFCSLILILSLLPAYFNVRSERNAREVALASLNPPKGSAQSAERNTVVTVRQRMDALSGIGKSQKLTDALDFVIRQRPKGTTLNSFVYTFKDGKGELDISGSTSDPDTFKQYADILRANIAFAKVTIPLATLAHTKEGAFSIIVTGTF